MIELNGHQLIFSFPEVEPPGTGTSERENCMKKIEIEKSESTETLLCSYKWLPVVQVICAIGVLLFWGYFFAMKNSSPPNTEIWLAYERSFPFADMLWITPLLFSSAFWLRRRNGKGIVTTIASGGALVFLGLVDVSFNIQQGMYTKSIFDAVLNGFTNFFCILFGLISIIMGWLLMHQN